MAESEEELKSILMKVKEESEKVDLKLNIRRNKIMAPGPISSVQISCSVVSDSLWPYGPPATCQASLSITSSWSLPNSCPLRQWSHPTISSSVITLSSHPRSFPASGSFQMNQLFIWCGQNIGVSASTSVLPMNTQDWFPLGWTGWISLQSKGLSRVFSSTTVNYLTPGNLRIMK